MRPSKRWLAPLACVFLVGSACGGGATSEDTAPTSLATSTPEAAPVTTTSTPSTTVGPTTTTASPTLTTKPPSTTTTTEAAPSDGALRATGAGTATVDGERFDFEVYACGWLVTATDPSHPGGDMAGDDVFVSERADRPVFELHGIAEQQDGRIVEINLRWRGDVNAVTGSVAIADLNDPSSGRFLGSAQNPASRVSIEGNRWTTTEPLTMGPFGNRVKVEVEAVCDSFGGTVGTMKAVAAELVGIDLPEGVGVIAIDDLEYVVTSAEPCIIVAEGVEIRAIAVIGESEIHVELTKGGGIEGIQIIESSGRVLQGLSDSGGLIDVIDGRVATKSPLSLTGSDGRESRVTIDLGCET